MSYTLLIFRRAQRELASLPKSDYERVKAAVSDLSRHPRPTGCAKLSGRDGWRIRSGDYRVVYEIDDAGRKVTVLHIGHRKDVYRRG